MEADNYTFLKKSFKTFAGTNFFLLLHQRIIRYPSGLKMTKSINTILSTQKEDNNPFSGTLSLSLERESSNILNYLSLLLSVVVISVIISVIIIRLI